MSGPTDWILRYITTTFTFTIEGRPIPVEVVKHAKLLGVELSDDLTWNMHVDSIVKKAAKRVYMLYQLKRAGIRQTDLVNEYSKTSFGICVSCMAYEFANIPI